METIINWFKSIIGFIFTTVLLAFLSGYLIGNYYATKAAVVEPDLITPHNIISITLLKGFSTKGVERYTPKKYDNDNLPKTE